MYVRRARVADTVITLLVVFLCFCVRINSRKHGHSCSKRRTPSFRDRLVSSSRYVRSAGWCTQYCDRIARCALKNVGGTSTCGLNVWWYHVSGEQGVEGSYQIEKRTASNMKRAFVCYGQNRDWTCNTHAMPRVKAKSSYKNQWKWKMLTFRVR